MQKPVLRAIRWAAFAIAFSMPISFATQPPNTTVKRNDIKANGVTKTNAPKLRPMTFIPEGGEVKSADGPACEALPGGGKKCFIPTIFLLGSDWVTNVGLAPAMHFIAFTQATQTSVSIEIYIEYETLVRAAFDPDVMYNYRLKNANNSIIATVKYPTWRDCYKQLEHRVTTESTPNIDVVNELHHVEVIANYRQTVKWC